MSERIAKRVIFCQIVLKLILFQLFLTTNSAWIARSNLKPLDATKFHDDQKDTIGELQYALDGLQQFMKKHHQNVPNASYPHIFDREFLYKFVKCFNHLDPKLLASVNAQWKGFKTFARSDGVQGKGGKWTRCHENGTQWWKEDDCNVQDYGNITIREPCNFASNLAYYHTATEICSRDNWSMPPKSVKAIGKGFAVLAFGSSFFHASQTGLGEIADTKAMDLMLWIMYQEAIQTIRPPEGEENMKTIILDLSLKPRKMNAIDTADHLMKAFTEEPVEEWNEIISNLDVPNQVRILSAFVTTFLISISQNPIIAAIVSKVIPEILNMDLVKARFKISNDQNEDPPTPEFIPKYFMPAVVEQPVIQHILGKEPVVPELEIDVLFKNTLGGVLKMLYAMIWQEQVIDITLGEDLEIVAKKLNEAGSKFIPLVNQLLSSFTSFDHKNVDFQSAKNLYPGQIECSGQVHTHSKWHVQSGIALLDFALIADEFHRILHLHNSISE